MGKEEEEGVKVPPFGYIEGRLTRAISEEDAITKAGYTKKELEALNVIGKPLYYAHRKNLGQVGSIVNSWVDDEGWFCIAGQLFTDQPLCKKVYLAVKSGSIHALSIGFEQDNPESGEVTYKNFLEGSLTSDPVDKGAIITVARSKQQQSSIPNQITNLKVMATAPGTAPGATAPPPSKATAPVTKQPAVPPTAPPPATNKKAAAAQKKKQTPAAGQPPIPPPSKKSPSAKKDATAPPPPAATEGGGAEDADADEMAGSPGQPGEEDDTAIELGEEEALEEGGDEEMPPAEEAAKAKPEDLVVLYAKLRRQAAYYKGATAAEKRKYASIAADAQEYQKIKQEQVRTYVDSNKPILEQANLVMKSCGVESDPVATEWFSAMCTNPNAEAVLKCWKKMSTQVESDAATIQDLKAQLAAHQQTSSNGIALYKDATQQAQRQQQQQQQQQQKSLLKGEMPSPPGRVPPAAGAKPPANKTTITKPSTAQYSFLSNRPVLPKPLLVEASAGGDPEEPEVAPPQHVKQEDRFHVPSAADALRTIFKGTMDFSHRTNPEDEKAVRNQGSARHKELLARYVDDEEPKVKRRTISGPRGKKQQQDE